jgi:zinc/manganese transport system substrate-binding protein
MNVALIASLALVAVAQAAEPLRVAVLHPLLGDLARQVGGERAAVRDLLKPGGDLHHFEPSARDVASLKDTPLIFASGMGLESYLPSLRDSVPTATLIEVGATLPQLKIEPGSEIFYCCPEHVRGGELIADGTHPEAHTIDAMLRRNIDTIVAGLKP